MTTTWTVTEVQDYTSSLSNTATISEHFIQAVINLPEYVKEKIGITNETSRSMVFQKIARYCSTWLSSEYYVKEISEDRQYPTSSCFRSVISIDNEFIRQESWRICPRTPILEQIILSVNSTENEDEEPMFEEWQTLRAWWVRKLREKWVLSCMRECAMMYFEVLANDVKNYDWPIHYDASNAYRSVWSKHIILKWWDSKIYKLPQIWLRPWWKKSLDELIEEKVKDEFRAVVLRNKENELERLSWLLTDAWRQYMTICRVLEDAKSEDIEERVNLLYENSSRLSERLKRHKKVKKVTYIQWDILKVETYALYVGKFCIWEYSIRIDIRDPNNSRAPDLIRIHNQHLNENANQHPHVNNRGSLCMWDRITPISKALKDMDYMSIVTVLIEFLENYNSWSPYISLESFCRQHSEKFKWADAQRKNIVRALEEEEKKQQQEESDEESEKTEKKETKKRKLNVNVPKKTTE